MPLAPRHILQRIRLARPQRRRRSRHLGCEPLEARALLTASLDNLSSIPVPVLLERVAALVAEPQPLSSDSDADDSLDAAQATPVSVRIDLNPPPDGWDAALGFPFETPPPLASGAPPRGVAPPLWSATQVRPQPDEPPGSLRIPPGILVVSDQAREPVLDAASPALSQLPAQGGIVLVGTVGPGDTADLFVLSTSASTYHFHFQSTNPDSTRADRLRVRDASGSLVGEWDLAGLWNGVEFDLQPSRQAIDHNLYISVGPSTSDGAPSDLMGLDGYALTVRPINVGTLPPTPPDIQLPPPGSPGPGQSSLPGTSPGETSGFEPGSPASSTSSPSSGDEPAPSSEPDPKSSPPPQEMKGLGDGPLPVRVARSPGGLIPSEEETAWLGPLELDAARLVARDYEPGREPQQLVETPETPGLLPGLAGPVDWLRTADGQTLMVAQLPTVALDATRVPPPGEPETRPADPDATPADPSDPLLASVEPPLPAAEDVRPETPDRPGRPVMRAGVGLLVLVTTGFLVLPELVPRFRGRRRWLRDPQPAPPADPLAP